MLQMIRDRATGWIAYTIVGLLIIPFAFWGVNSYFDDPAPADAAEVGGSKISLEEFQQAYQDRHRQLRNLFGDNFDPAFLDEGRIKREVLQQLVNNRLLVQAARDQGFRVGDQRLAEELRSVEAFQWEGRFDHERYDRILRLQGYTQQGYEENLRSSLATGQLQQGLMDSVLVTAVELDRFIALFKQKRELSHLLLSLDGYRSEIVVDEAAIAEYFEENKERFRSPEQVKLQYVELDLNQIADSIPVADDELQAAYEEQIDKYTTPEARSASHILVKSSAQDDDEARERAQKLHADIAAGTITFDQAMEDARSSDDEALEAGELGVISEDLFEDPAFHSALYELQAVGDVTEPVQTVSGYHVIRLDDISAEQVKRFAEVRDELAQALRLQKAEARFYETAEMLTNLSYEHSESLEPAAEQLDLVIQETGWFERGARGEGILAHPQVVQAAFSDDVLGQELNSEPIEVNDANRVFVVRLLSHKESAPQELREVRDTVIDQIKNSKAREQLEQDVAKLKERVEQGESLETLAEEMDAELQVSGLVDRWQQTLDGRVLQEAFRLPRPDDGDVAVGSTVLANGDQALVVVSRVVSGKGEELEEGERDALVQRVSGELGMAEFEAYLNSLRQRIDVVTHPDKL